MPRVVYSPQYNIGFFGLERLHPFDSRKYGRAWRSLRQRLGNSLPAISVRPPRPAARRELLLVHSERYLATLRRSKTVAGALELPPVRLLPAAVVDWCVLRPMRWATMGTIVAARECLQHGLAVNLSGGYHHAKPNGGEGFSIYADIAIAIKSLRNEQLIDDDGPIAYVDLDAHQGNGVCHCFQDDRRVFILDMYNTEIYPAYDTDARLRIDCDIGITSSCRETEYLHALQNHLPGFLDSVGSNRSVALAIYNAGTDVLAGDPLGGLNLSARAILERDVYVVGELRQRGIPTVMLLSGGYTKHSFQLVADSVFQLFKMEMNH